MIALDALLAGHPRLEDWQAKAYVAAAAVALQRRHSPGVLLTMTVNGHETPEVLTWNRHPESTAMMVDPKRATEDGAECIALAFISQRRQWRVIRRLSAGDHVDWLVEDPTDRRKIVLEISGTDEGSLSGRMRAKRAQAALAAKKGIPVVFVVRFLEPRALMEG
jgi:hypothetical protein